MNAEADGVRAEEDDAGAVKVGHWTEPAARTGCTVVLLPEGTVASGEVRGGAPATREFALLDPTRHVQHVDAVVLSGGSAFGLATSDGVVGWLAEQGRGFPTRVRPVPIVVGMGLFDLADDLVPPGSEAGRRAAESAARHFTVGRVGVGAGATWRKWRGADAVEPAGLGFARRAHGDIEVAALIAVNAVGELDDGQLRAEIESGTLDLDITDVPVGEATTIGVLWTNAALDKSSCKLLAQSGHNGLARALLPAHTSSDGDALVAASVGQLSAPLVLVRTLATLAVEAAIRSLGNPSS